ncbi:E3 ubiquitin-protein ligase [Canna indica]|uniref:E3 ubiquitin-protein ligase n=1 Tax=Canna indica TaxID=4628 RepID=A0AAQ3K508_9LILI|nr:E3 ubiquitin-protein ligase [Canna indica]
MAGMELDSPGGRSPRLSPSDRIVQRLASKGVPRDVLNQSQRGLILYLKENKARISELVASILPTEGDISELPISLSMFSGEGSGGSNVEDLFNESMLWLAWLMFETEPQEALANLSKRTGGQRAVCGAVWGHNDLAYRCRTCENDPTCAICVPCFQNGNHKDHDYSIIYTGGGCCDCGDVTAWKREGFCSEHRGIEQIQPLPKESANSIRPVLDALLVIWKCKITHAEKSKSAKEQSTICVSTEMRDNLSLAILEMLLDFCNCSESLLCFISRRMFECTGLLDVLVRTERFLHRGLVKKLHELLLKLLGEPVFKYEFAKVFIRYYPFAVSEMTKEGSDKMLEKYPLLSTFSVQIFTVPKLTQRLVEEVNLLGVLLGCLMDLLLFCAGEDGHLQANTWAMEIMIRLVEDTRFVLSHDEILVHITHEQPDISRTWLKILTLAQGMNPQKRGTTTAMEDEYEYLSTTFVLGHLFGNVHNLLVQGAFSSCEAKERNDTSFCLNSKGLDDSEGYRHSKIGRTSQESSACSTSSRSGGLGYSSKYSDVKLDGIGCLSIPSHANLVIFECLKSIDGWLCQARNISHSLDDDSECSCFNSFRKKVLRLKKGTNSYKVCRTSVSRQGKDGHQLLASTEHLERFDSMDTDMCPEHTSSSILSDDNLVEIDASPECEAFGVLNMADWPDIVYDVSSQDISFHIPLHRLLSLLLRKAMEYCYGELEKPQDTSGILFPLSACGRDFFGHVLGGSQPCGFSSFLMEHPLQLRVFCAQVRAGMWRRNGDTAIFVSEFYRAVQWFSQGLESDLFLLQCCAALAPPELFVERIQERYGLLNYTSLNISEHNEYEAVLVHEMLTLIIQIVKERRFSGLSFSDNLKREIIYKLAAGDATHSQVVKALPRDLSKSDQVQSVLDMLATYSNPSGMKQGKYSLRRGYWKELDLYHPRWSYRDLQMAEERYFHFCKVSARNVQLPRWTNIYYPLRSISRIATSKTVFKILRALFFYAAFTDASVASRAPDGVLITALHLLSLALDICSSQNQTTVNNYVPDDGSCMEVSHFAEDLSPVFAYATEELDITAHCESALCKNQNMISLLVLLMRKYKEESDIIYSETRHCNISSLIETLLKKFAELSNDCLIMLQKLAPEVTCHLLKQSAQVTVQSSPSASDAEERRAKARERQAAIMEKMRAEQSRFIASLKSTPNSEADVLISKEEKQNLDDNAPEESEVVCSLCRDPHSRSPLCYLILLQKSRLTTFVDRGPLSWEDSGWQDDIQSVGKEPLRDPSGADPNSMLQLARSVGIQLPLNMEPAEFDTFLGSLREQFHDIRNIQPPNMLSGTGTEVTVPLETMEDGIYHSVVRDMHNFGSISDALDGEKRCLTKDALVSSRKGRMVDFFVLGECVERLSKELKHNRSSMHGLQRLAKLSSRSIASTARASGFGPRDCDGIHISSCGHAVHQECHDRYLLSLKQRYNRRHGFEGSHIVDPDLGELLCPVCRRFSNSILPAPIGGSNRFSMKRTSAVSSSTSNEFPSILSEMNCSNLNVLLALSILQNAAKAVGESSKKFLSGTLNGTTNSAIEPALRKLCMLYYPHSYDSVLETGRLSQSLIFWDTLRYSVMCTEITACAKMNANSSVQSCLESLKEELQTSSGYMMSILLHVAQSTRNSNCFEVLLRFSSLQLLAGSICSGVSDDNYLSNGDKQRGTISSLFECSNNGEVFPDIQFWKHAADPILAQDPFSSLMWVLFCLPAPFISSRECFVALVHLFYIVCVVQSMITCYGKQSFDMSSFVGGLLSEVCRSMAESELVRQYFISNYIDQLCHPNDVIRRLTFPYLRRCALLWNLLNSSKIAPLYDSHKWERTSFSSQCAELGSDDHLKVELSRIRELEDMFKICSLELVLKDEVVHALSLRWCDHFHKEFTVRKYRGILACNPAVPFKLIELPLIYQELLQRYIKLPCSNCKSVPEEPALCLLCGKLCSLNRKSCCRPGKCSNHAMICGAGVGVFLLVRKTIIFLQRSARQAYWPSPYLDAFGEEDHEMARGKPLYLSKERYAALTYLVASHGLDRCSEVLRQTTIGLNGLE